MNDDRFFARLRGDARALRHQPDDAAMARMRAAISSAVRTPTVADLLAAWFRPLAATAAAIALAAVIGISAVRSADVAFADTSVEITSGGETYRVGN
jgi:hypothetical protein